MNKYISSITSILLIIAIGVGIYFIINMDTPKKTSEVVKNDYQASFVVDGVLYKKVDILNDTGKIKRIPADPKKEGYTFLYWEYNSIKFNFDEVIDSDITLNAVFKKKETSNSGNNNIIEVSSITTKQKISLNVGKEETLKVTINPSNATNKSVTFTSSNNKVATVDKNGKVTGIMEGTATITAKSNNGKTATCHVTVSKTRETNVNPVKVILNKATLTLDVGKEEKLVATISPSNATNKTLTWSSDNASIVSVDTNGKVKALKEGTTTVTVKTSNGLKATCKVTVAKVRNTIAVTSISLNKSTLTLNKDKEETLTYTISPIDATDKSVTWTSSNGSVATVSSNGKVTAKGYGDAIISVKTSNGKKAECKVSVPKPTETTVAVTNISLNKSTLTLNKDKEETLTYTISPSNATNKTVTWTSSNPSVATVDNNGKVTAKATGEATITVKTSNGKTATCKVTVSNIQTCGTSKIHFVNTANSDAFIIESCGHFALVDSSNPYNDGTNYSVSDRSRTVEHVIDYLKSITGCGSNCKGKLEFIVATHSHSDHIGGMPRIAQVFVNSNTKYYYRKYVKTDNPPDWDNEGYYSRAYSAMKSAGAKMKEVTNKDTTFDFYDLKISLMNTASVSNDELRNGVAVGENKNSIIELIVHKNGVRTLLAADMETEDEKRVKDSIGKVNVLKVGHHSLGTSTSKVFIRTLKPEVLIASSYGIFASSNMCYAETVNAKARTYLTGSTTDAIVMKYTNDSYTLKSAAGGNLTPENVCKSVLSGWQKIESCWFYYSNGSKLTGWQKLSWSGGTNWFYFKSDGCMLANTTQVINGKEYHFDKNGVCDSKGC